MTKIFHLAWLGFELGTPVIKSILILSTTRAILDILERKAITKKRNRIEPRIKLNTKLF